MYDALQSGNLQRMLVILKSLFAAIPYQLHINREAYYHSIFLAVMNVLGFDVDAEVSVSMGRIDAVLELADKIYIMEFKYRDCPPDTAPEIKQKLLEELSEDGLRQIREKDYANKYITSGKKVIQAAFAFIGRDDIAMKSE
jgi:hypothetical protein